jgi:hypothetical protein
MGKYISVFHVRDKATPCLSAVNGEYVAEDVEGLMRFKLKALADIEATLAPEEFVLSLDPDCYLIRSVLEVPAFMAANKKTVAMFCRRPGEVLLKDELTGKEIDSAKIMPYNVGVQFFSHGSMLQRVAYELIKDCEDAEKDWWGDQFFVNKALHDVPELAASVLNLPSMYNYTPLEKMGWKVPLSAAILHYKGSTKHKMLTEHPEKAAVKCICSSQ